MTKPILTFIFILFLIGCGDKTTLEGTNYNNNIEETKKVSDFVYFSAHEVVEILDECYNETTSCYDATGIALDIIKIINKEINTDEENELTQELIALLEIAIQFIDRSNRRTHNHLYFEQRLQTLDKLNQY